VGGIDWPLRDWLQLGFYRAFKEEILMEMIKFCF
jgi:hypothetical protein